MVQNQIQTHLITCTLLLSPVLCGLGCSDDDAGEDKSSLDAGTPDSSVVPSGDSSMRDTGVVLPDAQVTYPDAALRVVGDTWGFSSSGELYLFERGSGSLERVVRPVNLPVGESVWGADIRPADGTVIALTSAGKLYAVDPQTGTFTVKSTLVADVNDTSEPFSALAGGAYGVDFNPVVDRLRVVSKSGQNLRINVDTGAVTTDGTLNPGTPAITAAAYSNSFGAACRTRLYVVDADAKKLYAQEPPNDGKLVELASLTSAAIRGFDIVTRSDGSNVGIVSDGTSISELDLTTGVATAPRTILTGGAVLDAVFAAPPVTAPPQAPGELLATTASNKLITFHRGAPGKLCTSAAISGLGAGETIVGADVRPADGNLYALTGNGKLYTVLVGTAAATLKSTLVKGSETDPFSALVGVEFGVGFNPVPDRLRVISDTGVNLRINVEDGKVTTDSPITQTSGTPSVTAAAYTNSFAGAKSTTLWAIDSGSDALVQIGSNPADGAACPNATNPNCGVSTTILPLGVSGDSSAVNALDIEASTGVMLLALSASDASTSTLYTLNPLGNPAATPPVPVTSMLGVIAGGERVRSLSFAATPKLTAWVVTSDNKLVSFAPSAPQTSLSSAALSGLQPDETLVGIDLRPADGKLYGVGTTGRLYALSADGKATPTATLSAAAGVFSLPASTYGFDFNPSADALRLVDRDNDNLRVLPSTRAAGAAGLTFVDTALNPAGATAVAAAYTNNYASATRTTLYVIGGQLSTLYRQGGVAGDPSPNGGALTSVGALGFNSAFDVGFDIVGGNDGLALAVLEQAGAPALYSVSLSSGVATPINAANNTVAGATGAVRGLALELK